MSDNSSEILLTGAGSSGDSVFSGFGSDLNTPAWSEIDDSTETTQSEEEEEEEGDDFIAELTRQMAENMLQGDEDDDENSITSKSQSNRSWKYYCHGHGQGQMSTTKSQTPTSVLPNPTTQIYPNQSQPKHEYRQVQNREYAHGGSSSSRAGFLSALLQAGPGMRVVFLGGVGSRSSGSSGTGVFLPHPPNSNAAAAANHHQSRKKTGCSTVLMPERVLLTLKHHFEKRDADHQIHLNIAAALHAQQNQGLQSHEKTSRNNQELQLPQEWTY